MIYTAFAYIKYLWRSFFSTTPSSSFIHDFKRQVLQDKQPYADYLHIEAKRAELLKDQRMIAIRDFGLTSKGMYYQCSVSIIAHRALKSFKYASLLFKIVKFIKPKRIVELGTSLGLTTAYLAKGNPAAWVLTIEGSPGTLEIAQENWKKLGIDSIEAHCGNIDELLPAVLENAEGPDMVFFDGNHRYEATIAYFEQCLAVASSSSSTCFVFDDIHWSAGMNKAWQEIKQHPRVSHTIDLFAIGLVFFDAAATKANYTIYY